MTRVPHIALRGLYRQAGAAIGLATRLGESETLVSTLFVELGDHPLVAPLEFERLAAGVDPGTPLERALARIAQLGPRRPTRRSAKRPGRATDPGTVSRGADRMATGRDAGSARRVLEILAAVAPDPTKSERFPEDAPALRGTETVPVSVARHVGARRPISSQEEAREVLAARMERAGPGSDRPIQSPGPAADLLADLIAGRTVSTAALIGAAVPAGAAVESDERSGSALTQSSARLVAALDRIDARRRASREPRPSEVTSRAATTNADLAGHIETHTALELAGPRTSGLRRLAMRAGTGMRSIDDGLDAEQTPQTPGEWSGARRSMTALPVADDDLTRRIADILAREARRHGVETGVIAP